MATVDPNRKPTPVRPAPLPPAGASAPTEGGARTAGAVSAPDRLQTTSGPRTQVGLPAVATHQTPAERLASQERQEQAREQAARRAEELTIAEGPTDPSLRRVSPAKVAAFRADARAKGEEVAQRIKDDPVIQAARQDWANQPMAKRMEVAERAAKHMGDVFGFKPSAMQAVSDKANDGADATYDDTTGNITLNKEKWGPDASAEGNPAQADDRMRDFVDTALHEQFHRYQHVVRTTSHPTDDPKHHAGGVYRWNEQDKNYQAAPTDETKSDKDLRQYVRYLRQPVEADAWIFARNATDAAFGPRSGPAGHRQCSCAAHGPGQP